MGLKSHGVRIEVQLPPGTLNFVLAVGSRVTKNTIALPIEILS